MDKLLPIYDITDAYLEGISLVDYPAIQTNWLLMRGEERQQVMFLDEDKRLIASPILIPSMLIYRNGGADGRGYYLRWSKDAIFATAIQMLVTGTYQNYTWMHQFYMGESDKENYEETILPSIHTVDFWIADDDTDKIYTEYGFDPMHVLNGSLCVLAKVTDDRMWEELKSRRTARAFSVEGTCDFNME